VCSSDLAFTKAQKAADEVTVREIKEALVKTSDNHLAAAKRLKISRSTLYRRMRRLKLMHWRSTMEPGLITEVTGRR
jgi:transcriptional regulator with PAS, ATPase and Fis domain